MGFKPCRLYVGENELILRAPRVQEAGLMVSGLEMLYRKYADCYEPSIEEIGTVECYEKYIRESVYKDNVIISLVFLNRKYCGFCILSGSEHKKSGYRATLQFNLVPECLDEQIGDVLLDFFIEKAKAAGFESLDVKILNSHKQALNLFEKKGFQHNGEYLRYMKLQDNTYTALLVLAYALV